MSAHCVQFDNICRTCLSVKPNMKSVFDTESCSGKLHQLFQMLMACTSIQVAADDGLPAQICLSCINSIARSFTFKKLCEESDLTLRELLRKSTITDAESIIDRKPSSDVVLSSGEVLATIDPDTLNIRMKIEEGEAQIGNLSGTEFTDCEENDVKMMINAYDLAQQTIESTFNEDTKPGGIKNDLMDDEIDFKTDIAIVDDQISPNLMPDETAESIYPCEECTACFTVAYDLIIHSRTHQKRCIKTGHKCEVCSKEFPSSSKLNNHMKVHAPNRHVCSECGQDFKRDYELRNHIRTHTGEKRFTCKLCQKGFARSNGLTEHMRAHAQTKNFACPTCGKGFARRSGLNTHKRIHTDVRPHACTDCGKTFRDRTALEAHVKTHTGVKDYVCTYCGKQFITNGSLTVHERTHTGERPYVCDVCGRGCVDASQLSLHKRIHTDDRPHQCDLCPKTFRHRESFRTHRLTHTGQRKHVCVHCKKAFYEAGTLKVHLRIHTGEKPYTCKICNKSYAQSGTLSNHLKFH